MTKKTDTPAIRFKGFSDTWEQRKVREITDRYDNLRIPVAASLRIAGTTPYYGANGIQDYVEGYTHDGEFILVAEDGANDLKNYPVKCVKGRIWVNNHAHVLQGKCACADNQFLAYAISQADIESLLVGGGRAKLNAETLMDIELLLPSKDEQIQIGSYLARLDNLITLHQREYEKLHNIKKSMLEKMFPKNGSNVPEIRFKGFTEAWEQRKLNEVGVVIDPHPSHRAPKEEQGGIPFIGIGDVDEMGNINRESARPVPENVYDEHHKRYDLNVPSLGLGRVASLGKVIRLRSDIGKYAISPTISVLQFSENINIDYLYAYMNTPQFKKQFEGKSNGSTRQSVGTEMVRLLNLSMPFNLDEQKAIGTFYKNLDNLITLHQRELEKLQNIKKSMLEKMFVSEEKRK